MRLAIIALLVAISASHPAIAGSRTPPADFAPLTSLPWKREGATLDQVLKAVFLEPHADIRYPVLAAYLRTIPVEDLGTAFEKCIELEGLQSPDDLVAFFVKIWAERDPRACWKRTRELFKVVALEEGWNAYQSWFRSPPVTAQDINALRASRFYLGNPALKTFPHGVEQSALPLNERVALMREFADCWFEAFGTWPGYWREEPTYADDSSELLTWFERPMPPNVQELSQLEGPGGNACFEVAMRRWLESDPTAAPEILAKVKEHRESQPPSTPAPAPYALFLLWAKADLSSLISWAETQRLTQDSSAAEARGFLMNRVDAATRARWLGDAQTLEPEDSTAHGLMTEWAKWDPKGALAAAGRATESGPLGIVIDAIVEGAFESLNPNGADFAFNAIKDFDWVHLPDGLRIETLGETTGCSAMVKWGNIDIGAAARFGFEFLMEGEYVAPADFIEFLEGDDIFAFADNMIDTTFCALRAWAAFKPAEMEKWIVTIKDARMREGLTRVLLDPWGPG